jgi:hypothetical protein
MSTDLAFIRQALTPKLIRRVMTTFDKAMTIVVSACWTAALLVVLLAVYSTHGALVAKRDSEKLLAIEPALPQVTREQPSKKDLDPIVDQIKKRFPDFNIEQDRDQRLNIRNNDPSLFRQWLVLVSYVDTMSPGLRWSLNEFCVGQQCPGNSLMSAQLTAEMIGFAAPEAAK